MGEGHAHKCLRLALREALLEGPLIDPRVDENEGRPDPEQSEDKGEEVQPWGHHQDGTDSFADPYSV